MTEPAPAGPSQPQGPLEPEAGPASADSDAWRPVYPPALPQPHPGTVYPPPVWVAPSPQPGGVGSPPLGAAYPPDPATFAAPHPGTVYPPRPTMYYPPPGGHPPAYGQDPTAYPSPGYPSPNDKYGYPAPVPAQRPGRGNQQRRGGIFGGLLAGVIAFLKYGLVLFKFGKFGATAISMLVALWFYTLIWGWRFALGVVVLIFIHEMGHYLTSRALHVPVSAPLFIPFLGAFTAHKGLEADRRVEAIIAIGGPVFGFASTLLLYLYAVTAPEVTFVVGLAFALSYFGFLITLFNLIPLVPLDGGRVAYALSKWTNVVGLAVVGGLLLLMLAGFTRFNTFLLIIFIVGAYTVWGRFKRARLGQEPPPLPASTRTWIGAAYIGLIIFSAIGMSLAHGALIDAQYIQVS